MPDSTSFHLHRIAWPGSITTPRRCNWKGGLAFPCLLNGSHGLLCLRVHQAGIDGWPVAGDATPNSSPTPRRTVCSWSGSMPGHIGQYFAIADGFHGAAVVLLVRCVTVLVNRGFGRAASVAALVLVTVVFRCFSYRTHLLNLSEERMQAVLAAKVEGLAIALGTERRRFVHHNSANGVAIFISFLLALLRRSGSAQRRQAPRQSLLPAASLICSYHFGNLIEGRASICLPSLFSCSSRMSLRSRRSRMKTL